MCGIFGAVSYKPEPQLPEWVFFGLSQLQHRGQESVGVAYSDGNQLWVEKGEGLVNPGEEIKMDFEIKNGTQSAEYKISIDNKEYTINVFKPLDFDNEKISIWKQIVIKLKLWWKTRLHRSHI